MAQRRNQSEQNQNQNQIRSAKVTKRKHLHNRENPLSHLIGPSGSADTLICEPMRILSTFSQIHTAASGTGAEPAEGAVEAAIAAQAICWRQSVHPRLPSAQWKQEEEAREEEEEDDEENEKHHGEEEEDE